MQLIVPGFGKLGLVPEVGTSWALTRALGYRQAFAYYVGGQHIDARRAAELGLVNEVVPDEELIDRALYWCDRISALPPHALAIAKPLLRSSADLSWEQSLDDGGVQRADVHHHPRLRRGHRQCGH